VSWRDRLVRHDPADHADAVGRPTGANGTIGTFGNQTFSARTDHATGEEKRRSHPDAPPEMAKECVANSAESAVRCDTRRPDPRSGDAVCAESANRTTGEWWEAGEERAAIVQYDGGIPRAWAEGFARLDPNRPPSDVPPRRWQRFVDDVGRFLDSPYRAVAASLGWGPYDLFGCDRDRPFARIDQAGLLWLLHGDKLVELTETTATIETKTGQRQTWRRKPSPPDRVLAWELTP
jgi:hypothetical protein